ncbi:SCO1431 family membrane protein [Actinacidiphila sp. ITFR-21]|uniref:SCO1431 family membrane protein n=1 Tax=Actinacidiphila sp. ITFR-21 TaxID=3075199 RepID=UPI00288A19B4|nr:SCO1431 family membrane protein [Streptomyces sp. ITFR-21]WNI17396.1 SCO1431 family membrane protein [Streptomyces sp. ITFR-21]
MADFTASLLLRPATGTGGPKDHDKLVEHVLGWALTVLVAALVTGLHLSVF